MTAAPAIKGFRYPAAIQWIETFRSPGLYVLDHESGQYTTIYRYAPGYRQPSFYTIGDDGRRVYHAGFKAAIAFAEAIGPICPF